MSFTLAVESSSVEPSVALLDGGDPVAVRHWTASRGETGRLIAEIRALLHAGGIPPDAIALYAVGLGPGGFTGLRTAVATVQAMALPSRTPVIGICSADATALAIRREHGSEAPVLIIGDARRDRLWSIPFPRSDEESSIPEPRLTPVADAAPLLDTPGLVIATADWSRIGPVLEPITPPSARLIRMNCIPEAADVGRLALLRFQNGTGTNPVAPIYVHPPVFSAPTFTECAGHPPSTTP